MSLDHLNSYKCHTSASQNTMVQPNSSPSSLLPEMDATVLHSQGFAECESPKVTKAHEYCAPTAKQVRSNT